MGDEQSRQLASAGWALLRVGNARGAVRQFTEALAADPTNADAMAGLAQSQLNLGDLTAAGEPIEALLRAAPNGATGHRLKAESLRRRRQFGPAAIAAKEAVALAPREPLGYHILALCHTGRKDFKAALKVCDDGLAVAPGSAVLHAQRAEILLELRGPKAAEPECETALKLDPDMAYGLRTAARVALAQGDPARARDLLGVVLRRNANDRDAVTLFLLAEPRRRLILRWLYVFRYWRKAHRVLGPLAGLGALLAFIVVALAVAFVTKIPGLFVAIGGRFLLQAQYNAHQKAVQAHFASFALRGGF